MSKKIRVLVVGARGAFGGAVLEELGCDDRFEVAAMLRGERGDMAPEIRVVRGDATDRDDLWRATEGIDVLVYGVNFPYEKWGRKLLPAVSVLSEVAAERRLRVVFPGNVYGLDPSPSQPLNEESPRRAVTEKGRLRNEAERLLVSSVERGAKLLVLRAGDFFGPRAPLSWFAHMTKGSLGGKALQDPQARPVVHAWAYLPDLASTVRMLLLKSEQLGDYEFFHFRGHEATAQQMLEHCRSALRAPSRRIRKMPWSAVSVLGWFLPFFRELVEMKYLWDTPVLLDQAKLERVIGRAARTPLGEAVAASLGTPTPNDSFS